MNQVTRAEHLAWCKKRALEYVDAGDYVMLSDLRKHPDTASSILVGSLLLPTVTDVRSARKFVEGFN